jgi:L-iditol 2-dehydrogenase
MRAAVWAGPEDLTVQEVPDAVCPDDGALVRVDACGVSGGDVRLYYQGGDGIRPPWTFGHEISGELVKVGPQARGAGFRLALGERVHVISTLTCGRCELCRQGLEHVCPNGLRMGRQVRGGFAELVALPAMALRNVFAIPAGLSPEHATFADPLSDVICGHKDLTITLGHSVVVIGGGPVGVAHAALARGQGARVQLHEVSSGRLDLCRAVLGEDGVDYVDVSGADPIDSVLAATDGRGADRVIVATAAVRAQEDAIRMAAPRGRVLYFSDLPPGVETIAFPLNVQYEREIAVLGSYASRYADQVRALEMLSRDDAGIRAVVSDVVTLEELPRAFARVRSGEVLKIVARPAA